MGELPGAGFEFALNDGLDEDVETEIDAMLMGVAVDGGIGFAFL